jgi:hypothetical protein
MSQLGGAELVARLAARLHRVDADASESATFAGGNERFLGVKRAFSAENHC